MQFTIVKVGYTKGIYGCSGEYFTAIYIKDNAIQSFCFVGLYGTDGRIAEAFKQKGYTQFYTQSDFGRMTKRETNTKIFMSESEALEHIKTI